MRQVEWPVLWGRIACRWSMFFVVGCRLLPLLSVGTTLIWMDSATFGYNGTVSRTRLFYGLTA